jgi:dUTP pyrophosphatase
MNIYKLNPAAKTPAYATKGSAAFDLAACLDNVARVKAYNPHNKEMEMPVRVGSDGRAMVSLQPMFRMLVPTGLIFDIPEKHVLKLNVRSSVALKHGLVLANGTAIIDSDYVEETFVMLLNNSDTPFTVYDGERIAQGMVEKVTQQKFDELEEPPARKGDRKGGLGSTGK